MEDINCTYRSRELFPLLSNRLLSKNRPEYRDFLGWLNLRENEDDPLVLLARTGGFRATDSLMVFGCPEPIMDNYHVHFFSHGIRYLPEFAIKKANDLVPGNRLYLMPDPQNPVDSFAIALRTDDPAAIVGYCPRFLAQDFNRLLSAGTLNANNIIVKVEKVNPDAPVQFRLLCNLTAPWPTGFRPYSAEPSFAPLA
jgi:hypothetical protein